MDLCLDQAWPTHSAVYKVLLYHRHTYYHIIKVDFSSAESEQFISVQEIHNISVRSGIFYFIIYLMNVWKNLFFGDI